ncbi:MAG: imidazolonepropionase [Chitinophagales bacterium]
MQILLKNITNLVQIEKNSSLKWIAGKNMATLPSIKNAFLLIEDGLIADFGKMAHCPETAREVIDVSGKMVFPCWCDSHTHLVFAATREQEFRDRIQGLTYQEIAERGGGILNSARRLQESTEEELLQSTLERLEEIKGFGTGAVEIKSGYGLTYESELKILRVVQKLKKISDLSIKATFLGAHAIPLQYKNRRTDYVDLVVNKMLPSIAEEGLADYIDVFCEKVAFTVAETERIMEAGAKFGLRAKIHTNQFNSMGGIEASVAHNALSVDHLEVLNDTEIEALQNSNTMPTLLPSAPFFINDEHYPPARKMLQAGLPIALATDYNPGSTPSGNMPFVLSLACIKMRLLPEEAINAATINGAYAMELQKELGSICRGKKANIFVTKPIDSISRIPYSFGSNLVEQVFIGGKSSL